MSVEGKVNVIRKIEDGKRKLTCQEFGLVTSTIQTIWKNRTKVISACEQNGLRINDFESLNEVMSMRHCLSGLSKREVTVSQ